MDITDVKTISDFRQYVLLLVDGKDARSIRSLEEYLRALWRCIQQTQAQEENITFSLLAQLIQDAFFVDPLPFDESWLQYDTPPNLHEDAKEGEFAVLQQMICYQIADLHRMDQADLLNNPFRYYGIDSPTGYRWFNFDPVSYLECAVQSIQKESAFTDASWMDIAIVLWLGQIYE